MSFKPHPIVILPLSIFFLLFVRKANIVCLLFIVSQTCFKKHFCYLLTTGFLYSLSCWTISPLILADRQKKIWLNCVTPPFVNLSNTAWARKDMKRKQSKANVVVPNTTVTTITVTSSHTTLGFVTSIGLHFTAIFGVPYTTRIKRMIEICYMNICYEHSMYISHIRIWLWYNSMNKKTKPQWEIR